MTTVIDERVVEMRFNNADFEKNVAQSMKTLDELKKSLNFESAKSLENLGKAASGFSLSGIANAIAEASSKFSVLEIAGVTAIAKITSAAMDMGVQLVKSLSIDQVTAGFDKYANKTTAVQTIMASTSKFYSSQEEQMRDINEQMDKLMWFTDETSYNFVDMVSNIGKFTSNNVGLEESVTAMQGIANWAAKSGQNAATASRAMYNIAQAMGVGAMKVQDWKSIELANMATYEFKETAAETAVQLGKLRKVADGLYETLDGKGQFTLEEFREQLKKGWFDKDVMMATFSVYGRFTDTLHDLSEASGETATQILMDAEDFQKGALDIQKYVDETGMSVEELTEIFEQLVSEENEVGRTAFKNAQEAKTFAEVIDSVKDAVSTKWSETFEIIFGNYLEAKALWTGLANDLWTAFAGGGDERNEILSFWKQMGGRESLIKGAINFANLFVKPLSAIKQAFRSMFPDNKEFGWVLSELTKKFEAFTEKLQPSQEILQDIYFAFKGLFTIGKLVLDIFGGVLKTLFPVLSPFRSLLEMIIHFLGMVGRYTVAIASLVQQNGVLNTVVNLIVNAFKTLFTVLKNVLTVIGSGIIGAFVGLIAIIVKGASAVYNFVKRLNLLQKVSNGISKIFNTLGSLISKFTNKTEKADARVVKLNKTFAGANKVLVETGTVTKKTTEEVKKGGTVLEKVLNVLKTGGTIIAGFVALVLTGVKTIGTAIFNFFKNLIESIHLAKEENKSFFEVIMDFFGKIGDFFKDLGDKFLGFMETLGFDSDKIKAGLRDIGTAIVDTIGKLDVGKIAAIALAAALLALVGSFVKVGDSIKTAMGAVSGVFNNLNKIIKKQFYKSSVITDLAKSFAILAASLAVLTYVDQDKLTHVAKIMGTLMVAFAACAAVLKVLDNIFAKRTMESNFIKTDTTILALAGSIVVLAGAMAILNKINLQGGWKEWIAKVGIMVSLLTALTVAALVISKFAPGLSKGAVLMLSMALSMKMLVNALAVISQADLEGMKDKLGEFAVLFLGLSALIAASGKLHLTSALSLILLAKAIESVFPELVTLANIIKNSDFGPIADAANAVLDSMKKFYHKLVEVFGEIWGTIATLGTIALGIGGIIATGFLLKAVKDLGVFVGSIGVALAGIGAAFLMVAKAFEIFARLKETSLTAEELNGIMNIFKSMLNAVGEFMIAMTAVQVLANLINSKLPIIDGFSANFFAIAAAFVGVGVASILLAKAVEILANNVTPEKLMPAADAIGVLLLCLGVAAAGAGLMTKGVAVLAGLIGIVTALTVLVAEVMILSMLVDDPKKLKWPFITIGGMLATLGIVMGIIGKFSDIKKTLSTVALISSFVLLIAGVAGSLKLLSIIPFNDMTKAIGSVIIMFAALYGLTKKINELSKDMTLPRIRNTLKLLGGVLVSIAVLTGSIWILATTPWQRLLPAVISMGVVLGELWLFLFGLTKISKEITKANVKNICTLMLVSVGSLLALGAELGILAKFITVEEMDKAVTAIWAVMGAAVAFGAAMSIISGVLLYATEGVGNGAAIRLIAAVGNAFLKISAGLGIGALAMLAASYAIEKFAPSLKQLAELVEGDADLPGKLSLLAASLVTLGIGLAVFGVGGAVGAVAAAALAFALEKLKPAAEGLSDELTELAAVDFGLIAEGFVTLAGASMILGSSAGDVTKYAKALHKLNAELANSSVDTASACSVVESSIEQIGDVTVKTVRKEEEEAYAATNDAVVGVSGVLINTTNQEQKKASAAVNDAIETVGNEAVTKTNDKYEELLKAAENMKTGPKGTLSALGDMVGKTFKSITQAITGQEEPIANSTEKMRQYIENTFEGLDMSNGIAGMISSAFSSLSAGFNSILGLTQSFVWTEQKLLNAFTNQMVNVAQFGANGMPTDVINKMYNGTIKYNSALERELAGFKDIMGLDFNNYMSEFNDIINETTKGLNESGEAAEGAAGKAGKAGKELKDLASTLKETISSQLDMFTKFEIKTGVTAEQMLENMRSNIDGFASWSHRMAVLAQRFADAGIDNGLYKKLAELGPKGYETMNAFYQMSEEQLAEVKDLWATGLTLPDTQSDIVMSGYKYMGEMAAKGFSNALDDHMALHNARNGGTNLAKAGAEGITDYLQISSPSKLTFQYGVYTVDGFAKGMASDSSMAMLELCASQVCEKVKTLFEEGLSPEEFGGVGENFMTSLFTVMLGGEEGVEQNPLITGFIAGFEDLEPITEVLTMFVEFVKTTLNGLLIMEEPEAPSQLFMQYALMCVQGYVNGLLESIEIIILAIYALSEQIRMTLDEANLPQHFYDVGVSACEGMAEGIRDGIGEAVAAATELCTAVTTAMTSKQGLDVNSPSKVVRKIGNCVGEGMVLGILDGAENVYNAALTVGNMGTDGMNTSMGRIQEVLNSGLDFNPLITPMLDLSYIRSQVDELNGLFADRTYGIDAEAQNGGKAQTQQINFTQNNYSPKALSRIDIYRQTKNQISMMKGVMAT